VTSRSLGLASAATAALVGGSLLVRLANPFGAPDPTPSDLVPHLWGIGALVVLVLTTSWAPTLAWGATIVGSSAAAMGAVGLVRGVRAASGDLGRPVLDGFVVLALLVPLLVAAGYATAGRRRPRPVAVAAWGTVAVLGFAFVANWLRRALGFETGGLPQWVWLFAIALIAAMGLVRDLAPAFARTRVRLAAGETRSDRTGGALSVLRVFVDELVPGREAGRAEAAESERGRLAADLHADVLPSLRRALAEAEAGGTVERLAADLRSAVDEVESLLLSRRSIVLEEIGLLAGIEWLAERVEERSEVRVIIEVAGDAAVPSTPATEDAAPVPAPARPPREAERAAFRVAQLALDNVIRHAPGSTVTASVAVSAVAIRLDIVDDGDGPPVDENAAARSGRRGLADMRAETHACGASLEVGRGPGDHGTAIRFRWPA
jgi:signal transduction histidine kinase